MVSYSKGKGTTSRALPKTRNTNKWRDVDVNTKKNSTGGQRQMSRHQVGKIVVQKSCREFTREEIKASVPSLENRRQRG